MRKSKYIKTVAAVAAAALICTGCSDKTVPTTSSTEQSTISNSEETAKSIKEVYQEIEQTVSLKSPQCMDDDFISNYYGIDATALEEYVFSMSEDAAQAETVIIMKVKSTDDLETFTNCLQTVVDEKKNEMENYIPEQFAIVEKSKVQTKDNYIWLVISDSADAITDIIESGLF
ncbi:MAG: DUF4358 domain-containing protein [Lachnospiraceae bacterium]|nr:DUF4358 domain-containing protein [Lachnospiraceae bacterium]